MNHLRRDGVSLERIRELERRDRKIEKEKVIERICRLIRIQPKIVKNYTRFLKLIKSAARGKAILIK